MMMFIFAMCICHRIYLEYLVYLKLICLKLEISIEKYSNLGKVYITGDFNSRTASS